MKAFARLAGALLVLAAASPALAGTAVTLKADAVDDDGVVTLGEIFDGAGPAGRTPVATRTGTSVMLSAQAVRLAAARAGLDWANAEGIRQIIVRGGAVSAGGQAAPAVARGNVDVLTWARGLAAGEVVQPQDVIWAKAAMAPSGAPRDPDMVVGMAARHATRAGAAIAGSDVAGVQVIKANEIVTITYDSEGVSLALQAKALTGGAVGETINVQNATSKKVVQAVVIGPGQAMVGPAAEQLKLSNSTRYALR